jgi:lysozyme
MKLSEKGAALIKSFEGLVLHAYKDIAGAWTIGYGSTRYHDGTTVKPGQILANEAQANALFRDTLAQYENAVNTKVRAPLTQNQFDALVSFTYNEGTGALAMSTLLKKLNAQDYAGAAAGFAAWNKVTNPRTGLKETSDTLVKRRKKERELFITP